MEEIGDIESAKNDGSDNYNFKGENDNLMPEEPHQKTIKNNENEDAKESLIQLDRFAADIGTAEERFVKISNLMIRKYPEYLKAWTNFDRKFGTPFTVVLNEITEELEPVLHAHEKLLKDLAIICQTWDSRRPNLASVMLEHVGNLQLCESFIAKKMKLCQDFQSTKDADSEFAQATEKFDKEILNNPDVHKNSLFEHMEHKPILPDTTQPQMIFIQQLIMMTHENMCRYPLFMQEYLKLLKTSHPDESALVKLVLEKLNQIMGSIDSKMKESNEADTFLAKIKQKFEDRNYDVLLPGRFFLKKGILFKQARKVLKERQLILFSDAIFLCHLDYSRFRKFNLLEMEIKMEDDLERENWFILYAEKSTAIMCASKNERDTWVHQILQAQNKRRSFEFLQRRYESIEESSAPLAPVWVADDETTMCMNCAESFNYVLNRKHHCRKCGYVICKSCSAFALLLNGDSESSRVCPPCFNELFEFLHNGKLPSNIEDVNDERVRFANGKEELIKNLFKPSPSGKRIRGDDYNNKDNYLAAGTIYTKSGQRYARLTIDFDFNIYAARYDPQPAKHFHVQGYSFTTMKNRKDGHVHFQLSQQIERKNNVIDFHVDGKFESLWADALKRLK